MNYLKLIKKNSNASIKRNRPAIFDKYLTNFREHFMITLETFFHSLIKLYFHEFYTQIL